MTYTFTCTQLSMSFSNWAAYADAKDACGVRAVEPPYSAAEAVEFYSSAVDAGVVFG